MENKFTDILQKFLESNEGQLSIEKWLKEKEREDLIIDRWIQKIKSRYENNIDYIIEKLMDKYYSDEYIDREYKIGVQPREPLLWLIWGYARMYCKECNDPNYLNQFTGSAYYIGSYVIQIMHGQGSILRIIKLSSI